MKSALLVLILLIIPIIKMLAQDEEKDNSIWGKIALGQNFPNPMISGETTIINYKARDVNDVWIALYDENGKRLHTFDGLYPGHGQIRIRKRLEPGKYAYALFVNGRLVEKKIMEVVKGVNSSARDQSTPNGY